MLQDFDPPSRAADGGERLERIRALMRDAGIDALIVPHADEQRNEYLPEAAERLAWISGFTGSAGEALITADSAILFVDGRYTLQAGGQADADDWQIESLVDNPPHRWVRSHLPDGAVLGYDPALHTPAEVEKLTASMERSKGALRETADNLVDQAWLDRPPLPKGAAHIHDFELAGRTTGEKLTDIRAVLADRGADMCVLTDATSVSWLFNIRGNDISHTPLVLARAIVPLEDEPALFIDSDKLDIEVRAFLTQVCKLEKEEAFFEMLAEMASGHKVMLDRDLNAQAVHKAVETAGGEIIAGRDPVALLRAVKNEAEIEGSRKAHLRDGAAVTTFLAWLDDQPAGSVDEIGAAQKLEQTRRDMAADQPLKDLSFDTISGAGPNGAIVHYRVNRDTNRALQEGELYLCDSGAQYADGTTDITRTIAIGKPSQEQRHAFTLVLKGHIAIATARFPKGTRGMDIDVLARIALWKHGMDYGHGTGHGIGSYLAVHEGPQNISRRGTQELLPGMIISNEPGYYRTDAFGIRIENLVLVREAMDIPGGDLPMLGFETLSLAPIDLKLIDPSLMTDEEIHWLNAYHGWVRQQLSPLVSEAVGAWLERSTEPMVRDLPPASA